MPDKGRDPRVGTVVAKNDQVGVQPPCGPAHLASFARLHLQPTRQLVGKRIQTTWPLHPGTEHYMQWFEHLGATPGTVLLAGLAMLGFAAFLWRVNGPQLWPQPRDR